MAEIRPLQIDEIAAFMDLNGRAYPGMKPDADGRARRIEQLQDAQRADPITSVWGAFQDGALHGGMIVYDFVMQCFEAQVPVGGVGSVAVDLLHKKEKIARDLIQSFLQRCDAQGAPLAALYPFRPDFYRKMGFGYGARKYQYSIPPDALPRGSSREHLRYLTPADAPAMLACYTRLMRRTHGLMTRRARDHANMLESARLISVGYEVDGRLEGYLVFRFEPVPDASLLTNNLLIHEMVYHSPAALSELLTFLHTQADQIHRVVINTQDEYFHHLLLDVRDHTNRLIPSVYHASHLAGVGIMYRVLNTARLFEMLAGHDFGGQTLTLALNLTDSFFPANAGRIVVRFEQGRAQLAPDARAEVEIALDVAQFAPLVLGVVPFEALHAHGLAATSDEAQVAAVDRLFRTPHKPVCMTDF